MEIQIETTSDFEVLAKLNESVQSLHQRLYPEEFKQFDLNNVTKAFERMLSSPESLSFVAKKDAKPIGYILCFIKHRSENVFQFAKTVLYVDQISVEEKFRNQGVAQQLLEQATRIAEDLNIDEIQLDHWTKNEEAKDFFCNNGLEYYNFRMRKKF